MPSIFPENAVPAAGAEIPGAAGGQRAPEGAGVPASRAHAPQVQHREGARLEHVRIWVSTENLI